MLRGGFAEFDVEFKFAKIQNSYVEGGWGGWVGGVSRNLMLSSNLLKSKIPMLRVGGLGGWDGWGGSWNLMLSSNLLKSKIPMLRVGGGGFAEFDAEFKFAEIQNSYFHKPPLPLPQLLCGIVGNDHMHYGMLQSIVGIVSRELWVILSLVW